MAKAPALVESISTHAPRAGSDGRRCAYFIHWKDFNPRSPCGERQEILDLPDKPKKFQPTLPVRGATFRRLADHIIVCISTHAPRAGSDPRAGRGRAHPRGFQPTLPVRGATVAHHIRPIDAYPISTHAPRAGSDAASGAGTETNIISTHAPRAGSDMSALILCVMILVFQPTLPVRGATMGPDGKPRIKRFQPTLPVRGATSSPACSPVPAPISTHAPRAGSDRTKRGRFLFH